MSAAVVDPKGIDVRVGAGVGHGEEKRPIVLQLEVLVGELFAVDGFTASALLAISYQAMWHSIKQSRNSRCRG